MEAKYVTGTKENKVEIERRVEGFGGTIANRMGPAKIVNCVKLASEDTADLQKEIYDARKR